MLFSIIVPMFNVEKYADKCIRSIITQSFDDFELILVDDGSTDSTSVIIDKYAKNDYRIVNIHKQNGGLVSARKVGARIAKGDYIVIIDGDDWIEPNYLEYTSCLINKFNPDIICFDYYESTKSSDNVTKCCYGSIKNGLNSLESIRCVIDERLLKLPASLWSKVFRREIYIEQQLKVSDIITMGEDGMVTFPAFCNCCSVYISREHFYHYRQNPLSMTKNKKKIYSEKAALRRIALLDKEIVNCSTKDLQIAVYCIHAVFNVSLSYFRNTDYRTAKRKTESMLQNKLIKKYLFIKPLFSSNKEKVARIILKFKCYQLIKILSLI